MLEVEQVFRGPRLDLQHRKQKRERGPRLWAKEENGHENILKGRNTKNYSLNILRTTELYTSKFGFCGTGSVSNQSCYLKKKRLTS